MADGLLFKELPRRAHWARPEKRHNNPLLIASDIAPGRVLARAQVTPECDMEPDWALERFRGRCVRVERVPSASLRAGFQARVRQQKTKALPPLRSKTSAAEAKLRAVVNAALKRRSTRAQRIPGDTTMLCLSSRKEKL